MWRGRDSHLAIAVDIILPIIHDQREMMRSDASRHRVAASFDRRDCGSSAEMLEDNAKPRETCVDIREDWEER